MTALPKTILLIDDNPTSRRLVKIHAETEGFIVLEADNADDGVLHARNHRPDLIICDINMPGKDGYEVLRAVRSSARTAFTPFIFLTASNDTSIRRKGMQLGADDFLTRPIEADALIEAIHAQLKKYEQLLDVYNLQIQQIQEARKRLNLIVAHELRTPLSTISTTHELLMMRFDSLNREQSLRFLTMMGNGIQRMRHLVEQVVLLTQVESGQLAPEVIQQNGDALYIWQLVQDAVELARRFDYRHHNNDIRFGDYDAEARIWGDPISLKHAFAELINNALKFSPEGAEVVVSMNPGVGVHFISILDFGVGMTQDDLSVAMQEYQQVNRDRNEQQGVGLGLPLAKRIIDAHGGLLVIKSIPEKGTQVVVGLDSYTSQLPEQANTL